MSIDRTAHSGLPTGLVGSGLMMAASPHINGVHMSPHAPIRMSPVLTLHHPIHSGGGSNRSSPAIMNRNVGGSASSSPHSQVAATHSSFAQRASPLLPHSNHHQNVTQIPSSSSFASSAASSSLPSSFQSTIASASSFASAVTCAAASKAAVSVSSSTASISAAPSSSSSASSLASAATTPAPALPTVSSSSASSRSSSDAVISSSSSAAGTTITYRQAGQIALPRTGLTLRFGPPLLPGVNHEVRFACAEPVIHAHLPPPPSSEPLQLRTDVTVFDGDFFRPFLLHLMKLHREELPSFHFQIVLPPQIQRVPVNFHHSNGIASASATPAPPLQQRVVVVNEYFPFFKHFAKGERMFLTNMLLDPSLSLFLLPHLPHAHPKPGDAVAVVFKAYLVNFDRLSAASLRCYALPALQYQRLHCVLDLDNTLMVSVPIDRSTPHQRLASAAMFHVRSSEKERLLIVRPGLGEFLSCLMRKYDFSFCTMGSHTYATRILDRFRKLFPALPWSSCREVVSAKFTRDAQNIEGYKDLRMVHTYAHWPDMLNTCVIVDDSKAVWRPECQDLLIQIAPFHGPLSDLPVAPILMPGSLANHTQVGNLSIPDSAVLQALQCVGNSTSSASSSNFSAKSSSSSSSSCTPSNSSSISNFCFSSSASPINLPPSSSSSSDSKTSKAINRIDCSLATASTPDELKFNPDAPMDAGLAACWSILDRLHSLYFDECHARNLLPLPSKSSASSSSSVSSSTTTMDVVLDDEVLEALGSARIQSPNKAPPAIKLDASSSSSSSSSLSSSTLSSSSSSSSPSSSATPLSIPASTPVAPITPSELEYSHMDGSSDAELNAELWERLPHMQNVSVRDLLPVAFKQVAQLIGIEPLVLQQHQSPPVTHAQLQLQQAYVMANNQNYHHQHQHQNQQQQQQQQRVHQNAARK